MFYRRKIFRKPYDLFLSRTASAIFIYLSCLNCSNENYPLIPPQRNVFLEQGYSNDHFKLVKSREDSFLIEAVVADLGSVICYFKSGMPLLLQIGAELLKVGTAITNRGNHYKSVPANTT